MQSETGAVSTAFPKPKPTLDLLSPVQIEKDYGIKVGTQDVWVCTGRYGFRDLIIKIGRLRRINRPDLERWLMGRKLGKAA
jgi:hypothetical protein